MPSVFISVAGKIHKHSFAGSDQELMWLQRCTDTNIYHLQLYDISAYWNLIKK